MAALTDKAFTQRVKEYAKLQGADLVGVASMDRFEGAPKQMDPRYIFPDAKAMMVFGFRIPRGALRGIEEGTLFHAYSSMGYMGINFVRQPVVIWSITNYLEDEGYEAVPLPNFAFEWSSLVLHTGEQRPAVRHHVYPYQPHTGSGRAPWSIPVDANKPAPDVFVHYRIAAVAAGLGEIGYSHLFLSPEFGPRQRLACLLTDAPLEPDPLYEGQICDRCMLCARDCTGNAISTTETEKVVVAGKECEWGKFDIERCWKAFQDPPPEYNPFLGDPSPTYWGGRALEGARGCIRACMVHLEETGRLTKPFRKPFRTRRPWRIDQ
ncbi:MAG: epoxyqueuosine reductase [Anaerolineae bacterium]|nr:epoxyqueuosine reductase [Anaerolineae bacterium]